VSRLRLLIPLAASMALAFGASIDARSGPSAPGTDIVSGCRATDGDTIRCGRERIRLIGIDAPEMPGHCRPGRDCAPGDPYASTDSLARAMSARMTIERIDQDRYGRTIAMISGPRGDLSCWQLGQRQAIYKPKWDNARRVARACPGAIL